MKYLLIGLAILGFISSSYGQNGIPEKASFPEVHWVSKATNDVVTIENGTGVPIVIMITVGGGGNSNAPGINIKNCGTTTNIKAGSSSICYNSDPNNPVNFSSDKSTPVEGTYQIKQQ